MRNDKSAESARTLLKDWAMAAHLLAAELTLGHPRVALGLRRVADRMDRLAERLRP